VAQYEHLPRLAATIAQLREVAAAVQAAQERLQALKAMRTRLEVIQLRKAEAARELASLGDIEGAAALAGMIAGYHDFCQRLVGIRERLLRIVGGIGVQQALIKALGDTDGAEAALKSAEAAMTRRNQLLPLRSKLTQIEVERQRWQTALARVAAVDEADRHIADATAVIARFEQVRRHHDFLIRISQSIQQAKREYATAQMTVQQAQETYINLMRELGRCPLCGSTINDNCIQEVLSA